MPSFWHLRQETVGLGVSIIQTESKLCLEYNSDRWMIGNLKVKVRSQREQPTRRIRTQANENPKKVSFYQPTRPRQPLAQHKKNNNESDTLNLKKVKPVKSIALKQHATKLNTQAKDRDVLTHAHRAAIDKIFHNKKEQPSISLQRREREEGCRQSKQPSGASRYIFEDKVGNGTFGVVHKARDKRTLQVVAVKRVFQDKKYKNRELQILKMLNHPNNLRIRDSFFTYEGEKQYLNVVMDYFPCNLYESIQKYRNKNEISRLKLKVYAYQLFRGLLYLNSIDIAHRDIKPQNILVNDSSWKLIICDFGSAKRLVAGEPNLAYICSRCYRAPELIFGSTGYTTQIDMWSAGCILVEMLTLEPIFRSDSNIDQLVEIIKMLGTPSFDQIMEMNPDCDTDRYQFPKINPRSWEKVIRKKHLGEEFYDLLTKVLRYSPTRRLTPLEALRHPFFDELREELVYTRLQKQYGVGQLFDFASRSEVRGGRWQGLVPGWYRG